MKRIEQVESDADKLVCLIVSFEKCFICFMIFITLMKWRRDNLRPRNLMCLSKILHVDPYKRTFTDRHLPTEMRKILNRRRCEYFTLVERVGDSRNTPHTFNKGMDDLNTKQSEKYLKLCLLPVMAIAANLFLNKVLETQHYVTSKTVEQFSFFHEIKTKKGVRI